MQVNKILLVDDDPSIRKIAQITLTSVGKFQVTSVSSGADALTAASSEKFDLVILDVMMPNMDGPMTLAKLRALPNLSDLPVIFMTAKVQKHELDRLQILGARGVITKPFEPLQICTQIQSILEGSCFFPTETVTA
ncbi:MAG TPA: response regulator [Drouetiella sp.]